MDASPMSPHPLSPRRKRKRAPPSHSPPSAASPSRRAVGGELAKFRAVLAKNWTLKTRGASFFCFLLELLVPIAFVGLMCLPRALISDESHGVAFHRPNPIQSLAWSGVAPGGGSGAYKVVYAPNVTRYHRATAEAAAIDLVCGPPFAVDEGEGGGGSGGGSGAFVPSFMQQVALAAAVEVDAAALTNEFSIGGGRRRIGRVAARRRVRDVPARPVLVRGRRGRVLEAPGERSASGLAAVVSARASARDAVLGRVRERAELLPPGD